MSLQVLKRKSQIMESRKELRCRKASQLESSLCLFLKKLGFLSGVTIGDMVKSWDVLTTVNFLEHQVMKNEPILDIGCYASEIIIALHKLGYTALSGADLNPELGKMPHQDSIRYVKSNFMHTKFEDASFQAITSISVIEHGFDGPALLKEMSRLLRPNGYFIASFDYWPEKIDTSDIRFFDMEWIIFSKQEILDFVKLAATFGLYPVGEFDTEGIEKVIDYAGKQYTFGWLALQKRV